MLILIVAIAPLLAGCRGKADAAGEPKEEHASPVAKVAVQPLVRTTMDETVEALGVTQPLLSHTAKITTAIEGRVAAILPRESHADGEKTDADTSQAPAEGQLVTPRQVIIRLDDAVAQANVAKAEAALAEAQAAAIALEAPRGQQLEAAKAAVASAKAAVAAAEAQAKRLTDIERLVGSSQLADAKLTLEKAQADQHAAEAHLAELGEEPTSRKAAELKAKIKAAEADLKSAQLQRELVNVRSPIAGRLGKISVFLGQSLPVGTPVATVTDLRSIQTEVAVPAKHIARIKVGQTATIRWGAESAGLSMPGRVTFVGNQLEAGAGSFLVHIDGVNPDERFRVGLHVHAQIVVREAMDVLAAPRSAVIEETESPYLFVAEKKKDKLIARKVSVKTGLVRGELVQVEGEGLSDGAMVVTTGAYALEQGGELELAAEKEEKSD